MNSKVSLTIFNKYNEEIQREEFKGQTLSSAKSVATRWINRELFTEDYKLEKVTETGMFAIWHMTRNY